MGRRFWIGFALCGATAIAAGAWIMRQQPAPAERVANAYRHTEQRLRNAFAEVGLSWPPKQVYLRAFKEPGILEVFGANSANGPFTKVRMLEFTKNSGGPGPKRREGDRQIPEGFYEIDQWNPSSSYLLSLRVSYPNQSDRIRSDPKQPGGEIYIHGGAATVGCIPIGDEAIEELWVITEQARQQGQNPIPIHIFPAPMNAGELMALVSRHVNQPKLVAFWREVEPVFTYFAVHKKLPTITVAKNGEYRMREKRPQVSKRVLKPTHTEEPPTLE